MAYRPRGTTSGEWQGFKAMAWALTLAATVASQSPAPRAQTDQTPPTVVARTPAVGATGVAVQTAVAVVFSEPIQAATVSFVLRNSLGQVVGAQVTYDPGTRTGTLNPNGALAGSQTFTATVTGARNLANNQMAPVSWSFATGTEGFQDDDAPADRSLPTHSHPVRR